ncbi:hypothetical protein SAMN04489761_0216 [Tenacibaculum sp. MAR_2009_124]|uniref:hypothetical protein n=1 Tax=Tenacibaculum sp. MAR_2009_124 TaxID=1250059 RepID=UPI00089D18B5|nr:hypothetical protein [Tenacibaculum sp. MAR_2009_124]SEB37019.1 hypothetical protein SAMN04489761_0216 [Tenacibaculum sp. MAR_2009_124]
MSNTQEAIHLLEVKLKTLLSKYEFLKEENNILFQNNAKLQRLLQEKEQQLIEKQEEYDLLKVAKTIEGGNNNTRETKLKINTLVREIDKCIKLLST